MEYNLREQNIWDKKVNTKPYDLVYGITKSSTDIDINRIIWACLRLSVEWSSLSNILQLFMPWHNTESISMFFQPIQQVQG